MDSIISKRASMLKTDYSENFVLHNEVPVHLLQYLPFSTNGYRLQAVCRICLNIIENTKISLLSIHNNKMLIDMLRAFTSTVKSEMYPEDNLPSYLCAKCQSDVIYCYQFKLKCEKSNKLLLALSNGQIVVKNENYSTQKRREELADVISVKGADPNETSDYFTYTVKQESLPEDIVEEYLEDINESSNDTKSFSTVQNANKDDKNDVDIAGSDSTKLLDKVKSSNRQTDKPHTCNFCMKKFQKVKNLRAHIAKSHSSEESSHPCDRCKEVFCSQHDLEVHSAIHATGSLWSCNKCPKAFRARAQLRRHVQRHMEAKRHACATCGKAFSELYAMRRHERIHTGESLLKKFACTLCDKRFSEKGQLSRHESWHAGERRCVCACGKAFATARLLASHRLVHSEHKPYACTYCEKRFRHESTRNTHHRTHTGEKPYVCAVCGKTFIQNSNLTLHMRTHTGEKPYSCDKCGRTFSSGSSLKNHVWRHSGEKPHGCTVCGKRFTRSELGVHMRQHSGERPHACRACPKRFISATRLRDHTRIHTGEKPFECATCSQKFSTKSHLVKHLKKHQTKKKRDKQELVIVQKVDYEVPVILGEQFIITDHEQIQKVQPREGENDGAVQEQGNNNITLELTPAVEVTRELVVQDNCDVNEILVVDNSQNDANYTQINTDGVNYVNSDVNLVTVNEGTTVKLYQLDQSLVQIHSSGGQVTISKITSKMTANF